MIDETLLQDPTAEQTLIGAAGHHPDAIAHVLAAVPAAAFYDPGRAAVWAAVRDLSARRQAITPTTIGRQLMRDDAWGSATQRVLSVEMASGASVTAAEQRYPLVLDLAARRRLARAVKHAAQVIAQDPGDISEVTARVRQIVDDVPDPDQDAGGTGTRTWAELLDEFETTHAPGAHSPGIPTPWGQLDEFIGGLHPGRMYTIGAAPGKGKSAVAVNLAAYAAGGGRSALLFSREMPNVDVVGRFVAKGAEIDLRAINNRQLTDDDRQRFADYRKRTGAHRIAINDRASSMREISSIARTMRHRGQLDLLVIDYLQLVRGEPGARSTEEEIGRISKQCKQLAMELDVPLIVPAQLNRAATARPDGRPIVADLRSSGQIEQDSDVVILLYRPLLDDGREDPYQVVLILGKNRHGPTGEVKLRWNGSYGAVG